MQALSHVSSVNEIIKISPIPKKPHPLILGFEYLQENTIVLDFTKFVVIMWCSIPLRGWTMNQRVDHKVQVAKT